jgi:hypothetical protein
MIRTLLLLAAATAATPTSAATTIRVPNLTAIGARDCGAAPPPPSAVERLLLSDLVVVGKVSGIEADAVEATPPYAGAKEKTKYRVAVVKIDAHVAGADKPKEIKVGFVPWPKRGPNDRPLRTDILMPELKEGQESLFFLAKHPTGGFYVMPGRNYPVAVKAGQANAELETVKRVAAVMADPVKGLKSDKAEIRAETAALLILKYRSRPAFVAETEAVAIDADESKLILKGLAESDWRYQGPRPLGTYAPLASLAFMHLGLTEKDGWVEPVVVNNPGTPPPDRGVVVGDAFAQWLDGPGKDYVIKKLVPKKADK